MIHSVRMSTRGRVTLPKPLRDRLGLRPGMKLVWEVSDGQAVARVVEKDAQPD
ncbi:AbrB/MazE/SpoVT family DNA-binding domain-containing protein [Sphingomonas sp.]